MRHGHPDAALARILRSTNPWWAGQPGPPVPPYRRWCFVRLLRPLDEGLAPVGCRNAFRSTQTGCAHNPTSTSWPAISRRARLDSS